MITGGRIKHHLAREISNTASTLLFVGYQAEGTLGRQILSGESPVRVFGQLQPVKIKIESIGGFSAHADMNDLHRWLSNFKFPPKTVFLTHGEKKSTSSMQNYINAKEGWRAIVPQYMDEYTL
jgi:metallo-beta-lactamase family protein